MNSEPLSTLQTEIQPSPDKLGAYRGSAFLKMIEMQRKGDFMPAALFTDIDNTWYRGDRALTSELLFETLEEESYPVVAITGNGINAVKERITKGELPYFSIIASSTGSEVWVLHEEGGKKEYVEDKEFARYLSQKEYDRKALSLKGQGIVETYRKNRPEYKLDFQHPDIEKAYRDEDKIEEIEPRKMSFYVYLTEENWPIFLEEIRALFPEQKVVGCEEINYNSKMQPGDTIKKFCIDILPTTKGETAKYIAETTGIELSVIAGDSGNDIEMLTGTGDVSIMVGGAKPELKAAVDKATDEEQVNRVFHRKTDKSGKVEKLYYKENTGRLGPESILRALDKLKLVQKLIVKRKRMQEEYRLAD